MSYEAEERRALADLKTAQRVLTITDERQRRLLDAMAAAEGREDMWAWARHIVRCGRTVGEWLEDYVLNDWNDVEVAQRIVVYASPDGSSPWGEAWSEDPKSWTKERFRKDVDDWASDDPNVSEQDRSDHVALGEAALRHDGEEARRLGLVIKKRWRRRNQGDHERGSAIGSRADKAG